MSTGVYGTTRPADVAINDVDIFYTYTPSREVAPTIPIQRLNPNNVLSPLLHPDDVSGNLPIFGGLYNLTLPANNFSTKGFYTVVIRPKELRFDLADCGVLSAYPNIRGLVFRKSDLPAQLRGNDALNGYRVEYFDSNGNKVPNLFRIITSSNSCEPVAQNLQNTIAVTTRYSFNDSADLIFCTVTPSSSSTVRPNARPFLGNRGQSISLTNTFFNPITIEIEMVDHDFDTLALGIFGNQSKSIVDGKYTIYDENNNIYKQFNLYEIQDQFTSEPLYEVREEVTNVDFSKNFNNITT